MEIVDPATQRPVDIGEVGEIWVAGESVAAGYWRRAEATTFYLLAAAKNPARLIGGHARALIGAPGRYLGALGLAWRTRAPGLKAALYQLFYFAEAGVLAAELRRRGIGHLHNHFADSSCTVAMLAAHIAGATVLEKRYGRDLCRRRSTTGCDAVVKPPDAPPSALRSR